MFGWRAGGGSHMPALTVHPRQASRAPMRPVWRTGAAGADVLVSAEAMAEAGSTSRMPRPVPEHRGHREHTRYGAAVYRHMQAAEKTCIAVRSARVDRADRKRP